MDIRIKLTGCILIAYFNPVARFSSRAESAILQQGQFCDILHPNPDNITELHWRITFRPPTTSRGGGGAWRFCGGPYSEERDFLLIDHEMPPKRAIHIVYARERGRLVNKSFLIVSLFGATIYISR